MPFRERFRTFYDNNDGRFYDKSDLIANLVTKIQKYDMSKIKISSKRAHLNLGGNNLNLEEDEGLRRRISVMEVTQHQ